MDNSDQVSSQKSPGKGEFWVNAIYQRCFKKFHSRRNHLKRMSSSQRLRDIVVYVIAGRQEVFNQRIARILSLRKSFDKMIFVTKTGVQVDENHFIVRSYPNPTGILRLLGFTSFKKFLDRYLFFPSPDLLYVMAARNRLKNSVLGELKKSKKICLITSVPPHDISLIGLHLKTTFENVRWIMDWRDLWSYDEYYLNRVPRIRRERLLKLERSILNSCDLNIVTNERAKTLLETEYDVPPHRVASISHCFYRPDLDATRSSNEQGFTERKNGVITIGFLGILFKPPKVPGLRVLQAIENVVESGINAELHIFGDYTDLAKRAAGKTRHGRIILHEATGHKESLRRISSCDFLLLSLSDLPNCSVLVHRKLPEYLMLGKPILAMVPESSAVADIIRETNSGYVIPTSSNWGEELRKILRNFSSDRKGPKRNEKAVEKYSWDNISRQWLEILSKVSSP